MLGLVLNAAVLYALVWILARETAELEFWVLFLIALGVGVAGWALAEAVGGGMLALAAQLPVLGLLVFLLMKFCYVSLQQALIASGLYFVYQVVFALLMQPSIR